MTITDLFMKLQRNADLASERESLMEAAILTGEEITLFGRKCSLRIEWLEEPPMTDDR